MIFDGTGLLGDKMDSTAENFFEKNQCTEGWECNLGSGELEFFFANNGLGGFLGPNWKVFHHGTLCEHFQGVVIAFRSWPGGENGAKIG